MMHDMMRLAACGVCMRVYVRLCVFFFTAFVCVSGQGHKNPRTLAVEIHSFEYVSEEIYINKAYFGHQ